MDISIRRIFQLCAVLIVVAAIYRAGNTGFETAAAGESTVWDTIHLLIAPMARVYLAMFGSPATAVLLAGALVLAGVLIVLWFVLLKVRPMLARLDRLASDCARAPVQFGRGEGIDRVLGPSFLGPDWRAWRTASDSGIRPSAYITLASLERSGLRLGLMQALPNYFVGLGLVMTFLGLIAGLWFASQGMRTADMIEARTALVHLLNSATFKFLTSVAGISMSLIVSLVFRVSVQSLSLRLTVLCDRIEEAMAHSARLVDRPQASPDGAAILAERITHLVHSIGRLEAAFTQRTAAEQHAAELHAAEQPVPPHAEAGHPMPVG